MMTACYFKDDWLPLLKTKITGLIYYPKPTRG
jgi:hypothetical protein